MRIIKLHFLLKIFLFCLIVVTINSCKKKETDTETTSSTDNSLCEGEFSRFTINTNSIAVGDSGVQKGIYLPLPSTSCPDHWVDSADVANGFPITMMISYGTDTDGDGYVDAGCVDNDGKTRKGVIAAKFLSQWDSFPSTVILNLDTMGGYWVNGIQYEGQLTLTKNSATSYTQKVTNGECWSPSWSILWNCNRTLSIDIGDPFNFNDDKTTISGTASGTDRNGKNFSVEITKPLTREIGCRWVSEGTL